MVRRRRKDRAATKSMSEPVARQTRTEASVSPLPGMRPAEGNRLPKNAIRRVNLGQSFAEYDDSLDDPSIYVHTPALAAAQDPHSGKVFFVGRRGTGKTAIRKYCSQNSESARVIVPEIFSPSSTLHEVALFENVKQRPFRSLVSAFRRALQIELLNIWSDEHPARHDLPRVVEAELETHGSTDFDLRCLHFISSIGRALVDGDDERWLRENKAHRELADAMKTMGAGGGVYTLLIDSIDDYWEGTDEGLVYLTAFMHACLETTTQIPWVRTILFLRENIFERVRARDMESSRFETAVVGMEWTEPTAPRASGASSQSTPDSKIRARWVDVANVF